MDTLKHKMIVDILSVAVGFPCELAYGLDSYRVTPQDIVGSKKQLDFYSWYNETYPEKMWAETVELACHNFMLAFIEWRAITTEPDIKEKGGLFDKWSLDDYNSANGAFWKDVDNKSDNPCYETSYRRGYSHGYGEAIDNMSEIMKKGYSRRSVVFSIMANFHHSVIVMKWRFMNSISKRVDPPRIGAPKTLTEFKEALINKNGSKCSSCKKRVQRLHLDHIIPLADGGLHEIENMQLLCVECHRAKTGDENSYKAEM